MTKKTFRQGIQLAIGVGLIAYVLFGGLIDFKVFAKGFSPHTFFLSLLILAAISLMATFRWTLLCQKSALPVSFAKILEIYFASSFVSSVLPSTFGFDAAKGWYLSRHCPGKLSQIVIALFLDRLIGLLSLFIVASLGSLFAPEVGALSEKLHPVSAFIYIVTISLGLGIALVFSLSENALARWTESRQRAIFQQLGSALTLLRRQVGTWIVVAACAVVQNSLYVVLFLLHASHTIGMKFGPAIYFEVVPLGQLTMVFSVMPNGLGLGQIVYEQIFAFLSGGNTTGGATLYTILQGYTTLFGLCGVVPFWKLRLKPPAAERLSTAA